MQSIGLQLPSDSGVKLEEKKKKEKLVTFSSLLLPHFLHFEST